MYVCIIVCYNILPCPPSPGASAMRRHRRPSWLRCPLSVLLYVSSSNIVSYHNISYTNIVTIGTTITSYYIISNIIVHYHII